MRETVRSRVADPISARLERRPRSATTLVVLAITGLALLLRLVALGSRVAHQDEARVAYWAFRYMETGVYWYRPIVHGPFLTIVDGNLFSLLGASDFTMRLVVALLGGALPLVALLFRTSLEDLEAVFVAVFLAVNPLLLYYSRFYRNDVLLAGFMLAAFACFLRASETRRASYLFAGTALFALAFTTKENALLYPIAWAGALVLVWDHRILGHLASGKSASAVVSNRVGPLVSAARDRTRQFGRTAGLYIAAVTVAALEFLAIVVFFYAPRGQAAAVGPTLGETLLDPTLLPDLVAETTLGSWNRFTEQWVSPDSGSYLGNAGELWAAGIEGGVAVLVFAVIGFLIDRYTGDSPRPLVELTFYWGLASFLAYPIAVDNPFPWETVHVIAPLVVPAAVGVASCVRVGWTHTPWRADRQTLQALGAIALVCVAGGVTAQTAVSTSYIEPQSPDSKLVQYAQSSSEMQPLLARIGEIARSNDGTDVLFYGDDPGFDGDELYAPNESSHLVPRAGNGWFERLPFAWYLEQYGANVSSTREPATLGRDPPPVVIAFDETATCDEEYDSAADVEQYLESYERHSVHRFRSDIGCTISSMAVFVDEP